MQKSPPRIVQAGTGQNRPLVVLYHATSQVDSLYKAKWPEAFIANETHAPFSNNYRLPGGAILGAHELLAWAKKASGGAVTDDSKVVLIGFSEGCQALRSLLLQGFRPSAVIALDGIHGNTIPPTWQVTPWVDFLGRAAEELNVAVFTHTAIRTEPQYASTTAMCDLIASALIGRGVSAEVETNPSPGVGEPSKVLAFTNSDGKGDAYVLSYGGAAAADHSGQLTKAGPVIFGQVRGFLEKPDPFVQYVATFGLPYDVGALSGAYQGPRNLYTRKMGLADRWSGTAPPGGGTAPPGGGTAPPGGGSSVPGHSLPPEPADPNPAESGAGAAAVIAAVFLGLLSLVRRGR